MLLGRLKSALVIFFFLIVFTYFSVVNAHDVSDVRAHDLWVREVPAVSTVAAVFGKLSSTKGTNLIDASSSKAEKVELHNHIAMDGVMKMRRVDSITVPAEGQVELVSGGYHIMLIGLVSPVKKNEKIDITLIFSSGETLLIHAPVRSFSDNSHSGKMNH